MFGDKLENKRDCNNSKSSLKLKNEFYIFKWINTSIKSNVLFVLKYNNYFII